MTVLENKTKDDALKKTPASRIGKAGRRFCELDERPRNGHMSYRSKIAFRSKEVALLHRGRPVDMVRLNGAG